MRLESLELHNYGPYVGQHVFNLSDQGMVHIEGRNLDEPWMESNGSGKSSILDGLDWVLFGVIPRGDHVDSIVNAEVGANTLGIVRLTDDDGTSIAILRARKHADHKNACKLIVDGQDVTALDARETQAHINEVLGLDRAMFHAAVLYGQEDRVRFADATDKDRMQILTQILQIEELDEWATLLKDKRATVEQAVGGHERAVREYEAELEGLRRSDPQAEAASFETHRKANLETLQQQWALITGEFQKADQHYRTIYVDVSAGLAALEPKIREAQQTVAKCEAQEFGTKGRLQELEQATQRYQSMQNVECPTCRQMVHPGHVQNLSGTLSAEMHGLVATSQQQASLTEQWRVYLKQLEAQRLELLNAGRLSDEAGAVVAQKTEAGNRVQQAIHEVTNRPNPYAVAAQEHQQRVAGVAEALRQAQAVLADAQGVLAYYDFWAQALRVSGLKNYILDSRLAELNEAINEWTSVMTQGGLKVRLTSQTDKRTGGKANKLSIIVERANADGTITQRNFASWSGGEKQRVSLAIDFGLSRILARRARKRYDVMILDELFRHLDPKGRRYCMDMLQELSKEKSSIFVVDHDAEFAAQFQKRWVVQRQNLRSQLVEGGVNEESKRAA